MTEPRQAGGAPVEKVSLFFLTSSAFLARENFGALYPSKSENISGFENIFSELLKIVVFCGLLLSKSRVGVKERQLTRQSMNFDEK